MCFIRSRGSNVANFIFTRPLKSLFGTVWIDRNCVRGKFERYQRGIVISNRKSKMSRPANTMAKRKRTRGHPWWTL